MDRSLEEEESATKKKALTVTVSRTVSIPDLVRVDRCHRLPEYGPKILFFSGGSAIRDLSSVLKHYTHNSMHLITPFDSGGSSAELRRAFDMLSVGDLRNRLMALSDESALGNPQVTALFSFRLHKHDALLARTDFGGLLGGTHELTRAISIPLRSILISHLRWFAHRMPEDFDLCGASIGNLIITGCFLEHDYDIVTAIYWIWTLLGVKGICRPLTGANLHIRTLYEDGTEEVGQHKLGKSETMQGRKIVRIDLVEALHLESRQESQTCNIDTVSSELVASADVITFPMGSFFGSVLVNLLPQGVGKAIVQRHCPKVYIPNTGLDPEMYGYTLADCVRWILKMVRADAGPDTPVSDILNFVLIDTQHCDYCVPIDKDEIIQEFGIVVLDIPLVDEAQQEAAVTMLEKSTTLNPTKVSEVLLTLGS
jgi:CofD-related protein of GAK system